MYNRISSIQNQLGNSECLLVTSNSNRKYLTGFSSSAGTLFITKHTAEFFIDFRYYEKASREIKHCAVTLSKALYTQLNERIDENNIKTVYLESNSVSMDQYQRFKDNLHAEISADSRLSKFILELRSIKNPAELDCIRKAQQITDDTFRFILPQIQVGKTEKEIMLEMEFFLRKQGSEGVSFNFIVVSGPNSSLPHGVPTDRKLQKGDFITMDFGAVYNGYHSDMTRTVAIAGISEKQREVYNTVLEAQTKALSAIKPAMICKDIDAIARNYINACGYQNCFGHGLGHSVGIEVHESPSFNTVDSSVLQPGMVLTVEPGIYLADEFGVRIEDMVAITETGCENLTHSSKELIIL